MILIFTQSCFAITAPKDLPLFSGFDKLVHMGIYGILAILWLPLLMQKRSPMIAATIAFTLSLAYGISDEFHQFFEPERSFELLDMLADATGALLAYPTALILARWQALAKLVWIPTEK